MSWWCHVAALWIEPLNSLVLWNHDYFGAKSLNFGSVFDQIWTVVLYMQPQRQFQRPLKLINGLQWCNSVDKLHCGSCRHLVLSMKKPVWNKKMWYLSLQHGFRSSFKLQLPLEPQKVLCYFFTYAEVLPKTCEQILMCKIGGVWYNKYVIISLRLKVNP